MECDYNIRTGYLDVKAFSSKDIVIQLITKHAEVYPATSS